MCKHRALATCGSTAHCTVPLTPRRAAPCWRRRAAGGRLSSAAASCSTPARSWGSPGAARERCRALNARPWKGSAPRLPQPGLPCCEQTPHIDPTTPSSAARRHERALRRRRAPGPAQGRGRLRGPVPPAEPANNAGRQPAGAQPMPLGATATARRCCATAPPSTALTATLQKHWLRPAGPGARRGGELQPNERRQLLREWACAGGQRQLRSFAGGQQSGERCNRSPPPTCPTPPRVLPPCLQTAYHRIARHVQDQRAPPDAWPHAQQQQLGALLGQLNQALLQRLGEVQAHNLGARGAGGAGRRAGWLGSWVAGRVVRLGFIAPVTALLNFLLPDSASCAGLTLWSISKTHRLPQEGCEQLWVALQVEVTRRLATVSHGQYMTGEGQSSGRIWFVASRRAAGRVQASSPRQLPGWRAFAATLSPAGPHPPPKKTALPCTGCRRQALQLWPPVALQHHLLGGGHGAEARLRPAARRGPRRGLGGGRVQAAGARRGWKGGWGIGACTGRTRAVDHAANNATVGVGLVAEVRLS